jgi:metal-responsive CopG/Arc/MetJ family transcriptional regulator
MAQQLNINMTPELERALRRLMRERKIATKSEAIRIAVFEAVEARRAKVPNFQALRGVGLRAPVQTRRRFSDEDALWK